MTAASIHLKERYQGVLWAHIAGVESVGSDL